MIQFLHSSFEWQANNYEKLLSLQNPKALNISLKVALPLLLIVARIAITVNIPLRALKNGEIASWRNLLECFLEFNFISLFKDTLKQLAAAFDLCLGCCCCKLRVVFHVSSGRQIRFTIKVMSQTANDDREIVLD